MTDGQIAELDALLAQTERLRALEAAREPSYRSGALNDAVYQIRRALDADVLRRARHLADSLRAAERFDGTR